MIIRFSYLGGKKSSLIPFYRSKKAAVKLAERLGARHITFYDIKDSITIPIKGFKNEKKSQL